MKCLMVGAGGMLASRLAATAPPGFELIRRARSELDVTDADAVNAAVADAAPDWILNCSAFSAVDAAESRSELAMAVNGDGAGNLASAAMGTGARLLHISTDFVFDGRSSRPYREDDVPHPVNAYGRSKLEGERRVLASGSRALLIRLQWLFGDAPHSFALWVLRRALDREPTSVVDDQTGRPSSAADVARALWRLIARDAEGIYHVANTGTATRYDQALMIFERAGAAELLSPCRSEDLGARARRPRYTVLDTAKCESFLGYALPHWRDSLSEFLDQAIDRLRR